MSLRIAIDGPVGAGKSSIAKGLAEALGILHLDTGAMYRAFGLKALREGIDPQDDQAVAALIGRAEVDVTLADGAQRTLLDGEDVSDLLRTQEVSAAASAVSKNAALRAHMVALQQRLASQADMVLEGRDIGTRVLPDATYKFFLVATPEARAKRRYDQDRAAGKDASYEQVLADLIARDKQDSERAVDPLRRAEDAIEIDTTQIDQDATLALLLKIIRGEEA